MQLLMILATACLLGQIGFVASDWNQWAAGNNGVHTRPVYNVQPNVQWGFRQANASVIKGVINIDDQTGNIIVPNSASSEPLFWVLSKNGTVLHSFNDTESGSCSGTLAVSNGTLYVLNEGSCRVHAFNLTTFTLTWTSQDLCLAANGAPGTFSSPIVVDETAIYVPIGGAIVALPKDGQTVKWYYSLVGGSYTSSGRFLGPIPSPSDNTLVVLTTKGYIVKLSMEGQYVWAVQVNMNGNSYDDTNTYPPLVDRVNGFVYAVTRNGFVSKWSSEAVVIWTLQFNPAEIVHGAALIDNYLVLMTNDQFYVIEASTQEITNILKGQLNIGKVKAQLLYSNNVLYATDGIGNLAAYNVTDRRSWKNMWTMITSTKAIEGAGPSIALDGTIYIGSSSGDASAPFLVSLGCINGNYLNTTDGRCVCPEDTFTYKGKCLTCEGGKYFNTTAGCVLCGDGLVPNVNRTACEECPENEFSMSGDDTCTACSEQPDNAQCPPPPVPPPTSVLAPDGKPVVTSGAESIVTSISVLFYVFFMLI